MVATNLAHLSEGIAGIPNSDDKTAIADAIPTDEDSDSDSSFDAYDELFKEGDLLRKLRQLELQDEAMRQKNREEEEDQEDAGNDNVLNYQEYLRNQKGIYDDYKHVNYQYIDFGVIDAGDDCCSENDSSIQSARPLILEQDRTVGKGGFVWDAGFILAESVLRMEPKDTDWLDGDRKTKIIELGAGTGVTSLMIARARPRTTVHLTDLQQLQPLLAKNCKTCPGQATHGVLEWGKPVGEDAPYDIILGADVVAGIYDASGLAKTIYDLSHQKTVVYLACRERLSGVIDRFESHMHELFTRVEKIEADSSNYSPDVFLMRISGKRVYEEIYQEDGASSLKVMS